MAIKQKILIIEDEKSISNFIRATLQAAGYEALTAAKGNNRVLRVHMANIRRRIEEKPAEPKYIFTEVGVGYRIIEGG